MSYLSSFLSFVLAFSTTLFIVTYLLKIPDLITGQPKLIHDYYYKNFSVNVPLDFLLVFVYFQIGMFVIHQVRVTTQLAKIGMLALTTFVLTGGFCLYYQSKPMTSSFFSRWFHKAGYYSVIYDILLLVSTFLIYDYMQKRVWKYLRNKIHWRILTLK